MFKEIGDGGVENKKENSSVNKLCMNDEDPTLDEDDSQSQGERRGRQVC